MNTCDRKPNGFSPFRGWRKWAGALLSLGLLAGTQSMSANEVDEYQVKAAFVYNFTKFVEWPPAHSADNGHPVTIGVLRHNPIYGALTRIVQGRKVRGRELVVRIVESAKEAAAVDLLFVGHRAEPQWVEMREELRFANVLTVGESPAFLAAGGIISFTIEAKRVRFAVNLKAGESAGLKFSAQLLKLAVSVHQPPLASPP